ncbi:MAG: hypothetical protein KGL16_06790 [Acidobacteriota bacterium]|nr:hypothetical protein [Acidobacteriota bacterium]
MRVDEATLRRAADLLLTLAAAATGSSDLADEEAACVVAELAGDADLLFAFVRLSAGVASGFAELLVQTVDGAVDLGGALLLVDDAIDKMIADAERPTQPNG